MTSTDITYDQYINDFKNLSDHMKRMVRRVGAMELQDRGVEEIGSSDISCAVFSLYRSMKSFEAIVMHGLDLIRNSS